MRDFGEPHNINVRCAFQRCKDSAFSSVHLFDFADSIVPAIVWLVAAMFSLLAVTTNAVVWLPLAASAVFFYWAWSSFWRARRYLRIYPEGMLLSAVEFQLGGEYYRCMRERCTRVPFTEVAGIDLRGTDMLVRRRDGLAPLVLIEGLSIKKRHQFHHLFDVQQRRGLIPETIGFNEPRASSLSEVARIVFSGVVIFWILHTLGR